jgi:hypothetical protein
MTEDEKTERRDATYEISKVMVAKTFANRFKVKKVGRNRKKRPLGTEEANKITMDIHHAQGKFAQERNRTICFQEKEATDTIIQDEEETESTFVTGDSKLFSEYYNPRKNDQKRENRHQFYRAVPDKNKHDGHVHKDFILGFGTDGLLSKKKEMMSYAYSTYFLDPNKEEEQSIVISSCQLDGHAKPCAGELPSIFRKNPKIKITFKRSKVVMAERRRLARQHRAPGPMRARSLNRRRRLTTRERIARLEGR